jgi:hypothetical protein
MFLDAGFSEAEATARGRMMVVYMMGEFSMTPDKIGKNRDLLRRQYETLIAPGVI